MTVQSRILLFGAGSIGTVYTYVLKKAGASVTVVCRSNYEEAKSSGFSIKSDIFGHVNIKPDDVVRSPSESLQQDSTPFDFIVVCVKAFPGLNPSQAELIAPVITSEHTAIVLVQNGIGIESEYSKLFPNNPIISCVVYLPATQESAAVVVHKEHELLHIGTYPAHAADACKSSAEQFANLINGGGATTNLHGDIQPERWKKLMVNASWNPICALTRSRDAQFLKSSPAATEFVRNIMLEVASVARAVGCGSITDKIVDLQLARALARDLPGVEPSMMADAIGGRLMEVEAILGNTVRLAKDHNVVVPILDGLYVLTKALDQSIYR